jgi:hypothetical protein
MLSNERNWFCVVLVLVACAGTAMAEPVTVYDNFGPGSGGFEYETGMSWMLAGFYSGFVYVEQAQSFTPGETGYLADIYVGLMEVLGVNECYVMLAPDHGAPPSEGDVLETWVLYGDDLPPPGGGEPRPATRLVSYVHPLLTAGQSYWIWIRVNQGSSASWGLNVTGAIGHMMQYKYVYPYGYIWEDMALQTLGALRVDVISGASGDFDEDGDVDGDDAVAFILCYFGGGTNCDLGDFDGDGDVDCHDWAMFKAVWTGPPTYPALFPECDLDCNGNLVADDIDIADGISQDCNANGIPDECDIADGMSQDCNANGIPDECDIADGMSQDCNANGIPDECDLAGGMSQDCNANGVPDECDIAGSVSDDCQPNGIPDECDIADGTSDDENENGIPDECELSSTDIVYNNFGPGSGGFEYETGVSWMLAGHYSFFEYVEEAQSFTPSETGYLADIYVGLMEVLGVNECYVMLAPDHGAPPSEGDVLETWVLYGDDLPPPGGGEPRPATRLVSYVHPLLTAGQSYWIWIRVNQGSSASWGLNVTGAIGHMMQRRYVYGLVWVDIGNQTLGALRVDVASALGDLNCDGVVNAFDIDPFVVALTDPNGYEAAYPDCDRWRADINGDGAVNAFDVDPFVELLTGG